MKKHYTTKEKLLEICKECAKEKGINGFGMRDVAHASGLALGTIYNYFTDKETMIIETLLSIWKDFISCIPNTESFHDYLERQPVLFHASPFSPVAGMYSRQQHTVSCEYLGNIVLP